MDRLLRTVKLRYQHAVEEPSLWREREELLPWQDAATRERVARCEAWEKANGRALRRLRARRQKTRQRVERQRLLRVRRRGTVWAVKWAGTALLPGGELDNRNPLKGSDLRYLSLPVALRQAALFELAWWREHSILDGYIWGYTPPFVVENMLTGDRIPVRTVCPEIADLIARQKETHMVARLVTKRRRVQHERAMKKSVRSGRRRQRRMRRRERRRKSGRYPE
jgi:hypothetical protein